VSVKKPVQLHPYVHQAIAQVKRGELGRREFLRTATRLGLSAVAAYTMLGAVGGARIVPQARAEGTPKKGGNLRVSMNVMESADPARYDWSQKSNLARHVTEPLVQIGQDGIARPHLLERWAASDDLKTWTLNLRPGIKWSNGDDFTAADVAFNFNRWLDPKTGSSNQGRFASMTTKIDTGQKDDSGNAVLSTVASEGAIEVADDLTVRLHLNTPDLAVPESLADYPALIVHRRFEEEGGDLTKNPVGTGPFTLKEFAVGQKAILVRRPDPYWGGDVYLDQITYIDHGDDPAAAVAAIASGQVDAQHQSSIEQVDTIRALPGMKVYEAITAQTGVARMRVTERPFDNKLVRKAIQACIDPQRLLEVVYQNHGAVGEDHHVAPIHPEYFALPKPKQDYDLAKKHLADAGFGEGLDITIDCVANPTWEQNTCKALAEMVKPAGIRLAVNVMPGGTYWDRWLTAPFGFTSWAHRALGVQVLNLAYRSGVAWNETGYANPAFDALLDEAGTKIEAVERRKVMEKIEAMLQDDAIISQDYWRSVFTAAHERVRGFFTQVALEHHYTKVWLA